jgi:phosphotransferase system enzyme I (PtsI)
MKEQLETYRMLAEEMSPHAVAVRTLDAGGDRTWSRAEPASEPNPSMGLRGIRLSLRAPGPFAEQIEAILRASAYGNLEIVLPMVSTVEELWEAKKVIEGVRTELLARDHLASQSVPVGAMIEVPAAVLTLESLAREVDFLCVGTNDLIQYLLAVDRDNPQVAHLFQPLHPSILQCLSSIAAVARKLQKPVRICGEMSSNPFFAVLLMGMGYVQLSMNPHFIPAIKQVIRSVTVHWARDIVERVLQCTTAEEIADMLIQEVTGLVQMDFSPYLQDFGPRGRARYGPSRPGSGRREGTEGP